MADPVTSNKFLAQPIRATDIGVWDVPMNANSGIIDNSFGGLATITLSNSPVSLSSAQYQCAFLRFIGALSANVPITLPPIGSFYSIINDTTNSSAFYLTAATSVAGGRIIGLPPGTITDIMTDGVHTRFRGLPSTGTYWDYCGSSTPAWNDICTVPPWLYCNGTAFSSATYPVLANVLNGTTLPDFRGRSAIPLNDGSSRILSSTSGIDGNTSFASGGTQSVALSSRHLPATSFAVTDPGHVHTITHNANTGTTGPIDSSVNVFAGSVAGSNVIINSTTANITVGTGGSNTQVPLMSPTTVVGIRHIRAA